MEAIKWTHGRAHLQLVVTGGNIQGNGYGWLPYVRQQHLLEFGELRGLSI